MQPTRDQMLHTQHVKVVVKIESYCEMRTNLFVREGNIERISLSGKFRRARMA
jgi:hypothetical protein